MIRFVLAAACLAPTAAFAQTGPVRAMLDAAAETGKLNEIAAVASAARRVYPDDAEAIDAYARALMTAVTAKVTSDILTVKASPPPEKKAPSLDASVDAVDFPPGAAPKWLKLGPWAGKAVASGLVSSGNSKNAAAGLHIEARREIGAMTHRLTGYFDYGKSRGVKNQERWGGSYKLDYLLGDNTYAYGRFSYDEDAFSGYDYKIFGGLGVGRYFVRKPALQIKAEAGPGYQYSPIDGSNEVEKRAAIYASNEIDWVIRAGLKFEQDLNGTWTSPTTTLMSKTALTISLTDTLSTGVSFLYRYETDPPPGRFNTDTTLRMNLIYGF
ncbi:MAG: YdiY family protein [Amphiplicatus sp.]